MSTSLLTRAGALGEIMLDRPEQGNALDREITVRLHDAVLEVASDRGVRALLIHGAGASFCRGGDLKDFLANRGRIRAHFRDLLEHMNATVALLAALDRPVVVALHGAVAGVGVSLALAGDVRIAAAGMKLRLAYTAVGLTPDGGASYFLTRMLGPARALDLLLTNRDLSAEEAEAWGLVSRVVPAPDLLPAARTLAASLAHGPTSALARTKRLVQRAQTATLEQHLRDELEVMLDSGESAEFAEGLDAFLAKRRPTFS